jgi:glycosyltransferase involved in cell wall biosynthesis
MRIAIAHFHLQTGGVTRVIQHACAALAAAGHRVVVLSGEPPRHPALLAAPVEVIPALGYEERRERLGPSALRQAMEQAARRALAGAPDLWHLHNHCLGKNLALPGAICGLAGDGHRLLLQVHDFVEDGRPALYRRMLETLGAQDGAALSAQLYPLAPQIHYAVLSTRDQRFLAAAGVATERLHRLPNAVALSAGDNAGHSARHSPGDHRRAQDAAHGERAQDCQPLARPDHRRWLYPTRAIRRKNIGELLFWAALAGPGDRFAITQAPLNPLEQPSYRRWVALSQALRLPVDFELGGQCDDLDALLASSHALIGTSIAEGFGLAFLEPWLAARPLAGRDLPEITSDFTAAGINLSALYQRLPLPLDWLDAAALRERMDRALTANARAYGRVHDGEQLEQAWNAAVDATGRIDFGRLDEDAQAQVIEHLQTDASAPSALDATMPPLASEADLIADNRTIIERDYGIASYGRRLETIYRALLAQPSAPPRGHADGQSLIERFQAPERLWLLRT